MFARLPLHAVGDYISDGGECCSDYVVSSYTPTLQALINARSSQRPIKRAEAQVLLGAAPYPFRGSSIPFTVNEIKEVAKSIPEGLILPLPAEENVLRPLDPDSGVVSHGGITVPTALRLLPSATILHIASHGQSNPDKPLEGGFLLKDDKLTLVKLMQKPLPNAWLAVLSACETAKGAEDLSDETLHLAATMMFAGFKSVVATMWFV